MKTINDYTLVELINKYKHTIGEDIGTFLMEAGFNKGTVDILIERGGMQLLQDKNSTTLIDSIYKVLCDSFEGREENDQYEHKVSFLGRVYRFCSSKMRKEELDELRELILDGLNYTILKFDDVDKFKGFMILTDDPKKKILSLKSVKSRKTYALAIQIGMYCDDMESLIDIKYPGAGKIVKEMLERCNKEEKEDFYSNNLQMFYPEDLLLNAAARVMLGIQRNTQVEATEIGGNGKDDGIANSIAIIRDINREIEKLDEDERTDSNYTIIEDDGRALININKTLIEEFLSRCVSGKYFTEEQIERIQKEVLRGNIPEAEDERKAARIDKRYVINLSKKYEVMPENDVNKPDILKSATKLANDLIKQQKLSYDELLKYYFYGLVDLDIMKRVDIKDMPRDYFDNIFKKMYDEYLQENDKDKKREITNNITCFGKLYKEIEKTGKVDSEALVLDLLTIYGEEKSVEIVDALNKIGVLSIEHCCNLVGMDLFIKRYNEGSFTPGIIRDLYDKKVIDLSNIADFIKYIPEPEKKYLSIGAIFPGENQTDTIDRDLLVSECITVEDGIKTKGNRRKKKIDPKPKSDEYITDPYARLNLFKELDKDYELTITSDGHAIVRCPNSKKVIIEQLLDKEGNPFYGAATYILDETYFDSNYNYIYVNGKIARSELVNNANTPGVNRIIHSETKWGEQIKDDFGVTVGSKYTQEDVNKIEDALKRVERSRTKK